MDPLSLIIFLGLGGLIAWLIARAARKRGFSFAKYFWVSFLLGLLGWIICAIMWQIDKGKVRNRAPSETPASPQRVNHRPDVGRASHGPIMDNRN